MRDLALQTGRSLSGLYHYFSTKDELLFLINIHGFSYLFEGAKALNCDLSDPMQKLYGMIYNHVRFFGTNRDEMKVMLWGTQPLPPDKSRVIRNIKNEYNLLVQSTVSEVLKSRSNMVVAEAELSRKTYLLFGMMNWAFAWYVPSRHGALDEVVDDIYFLFVHGASFDPAESHKDQRKFFASTKKYLSEIRSNVP